jgi:RHH-type proline utilization regulon transcriptional repressor/proline dehydrogenase/delta 1-pyrroline-5-carboxylate dehydrogenase
MVSQGDLAKADLRRLDQLFAGISHIIQNERAAMLLANPNTAQLETRTLEIGRDLFARARAVEAQQIDSLQSKLDHWLMRQGMRDEAIKAQLFRFIDVLAVLKSPAAINRHLKEYLGTAQSHLPPWQKLAVRFMPITGPSAAALAKFARFSTERMARRFIAASDLPGAVQAVQALRQRGLAFTIDLLGEAVLSEADATRYAQRYHDLITGLADAASRGSTIELIDRDERGSIPPINISIKLSSLFSQFDPIDPVSTLRGVGDRLRPILRSARSRGVFVNIDMEQYTLKDATLRIFQKIFAEAEFRDWPDVGIAIQAYLKDTAGDLQALLNWAERRGTPIWVRLVKGAYWDYESVIAAQNDWPLPVFPAKNETDANYEAMTTYLMEHRGHLRPAIASHNIRSIAHALAVAEAHDVPARSFEFQMLYGMADPIKTALADLGHRVRIYTPFGDLLPGMAYLVRRLLENTSNESFLRAGFEQHLPEEQLLMNPLTLLRRSRPVAAPVAPDVFRNEPATDFSREENPDAMQDELRSLQPYLGATYKLMIGGKLVSRDRTIDSFNPSHRKQVVGRVCRATVEDATAAIAAAKAAFPAWRDTPVRARAKLLKRAAEVLRRRRFELAAWEVYETAKPWREADADLAEAIDFCEFYARQSIALVESASDGLIGAPGEENTSVYEPRGVTVVIAPWNFPLAILCGMTTAALATGNTVIMKPAEQSAVIGAKLMEVLVEAGFPPGVVNFLPGDGAELGPTLVRHPDVATIAFTGSRAVGLSIQTLAADTTPAQDHIKRVITEMGGKNAIIIDDDADLDEAVAGVVASTFGYAGQKCSACSRLIVLDAIYDALLPRLIEATASIRVGPAEDPATTVPPVIDDEARERIEKIIASAKSQFRVAFAGDLKGLEQEGSYVAPHVFADVSADSSLAQEEIFGPVLAVIRAKDLDQALAFANGTQYALTGGIYSRSPANIDRVRREFRVGNLYINRKITGALVGRQPFGGFKLSGIGSQAGGTPYLRQFMLPRTITENTLRRGFVPSNNPA